MQIITPEERRIERNQRLLIVNAPFLNVKTATRVRPQEKTTIVFRIAEIAIRVENLDRAIAFYQNFLGFKFHHREADVVFLEVGALNSPLGKVGHPQLLALFGRGQSIDATLSTLDHIAFEVPDAQYDLERSRFADLEMIIRERSWPDSLPWNGRSFFVRDPDGNVIEVIAANSD